MSDGGQRPADDDAVPPTPVAIAVDRGVQQLRTGRGTEALASFHAALTLDPDFPITHYNIGCALEVLGQDDEAIAWYRRALVLLPELVEAEERLASLLLAQGHREQAIHHFRAAAETAPDEPVGWRCAAHARMEEGDAEAAADGLRAALALAPAEAELHRLHGAALRELGRFEEARGAFERALEHQPGQVSALNDLVQAGRLTQGERRLVDRLEAALGRPDLTDAQRRMLHFALGKAHDDLGHYARAIHHFDTANALKRRTLTFNRPRFAAVVDALIDGFGDGGRSDAAAELSERPILIVGMMRSGTTLVEQILSCHAEIGAGGELPFWDLAGTSLGVPGNRLTPAQARQAASDYLAVLERAAPGRARVTDKTPLNFQWIGLIRQAFAHARFIHCRRDPVDTCLSIYFTDFLTRKEFAYDRGDLAFYWHQYARLMEHWRASLPADRFLEVDYEELVAFPEAVSRRMIAFAGLAWDPACLQPDRNPRVIRTASLWQARQPVYVGSVARWRNYAPWLGELASLHAAGSIGSGN